MNKKACLFLGTSGYSYSDWKGIFYPKALATDRWLEYYAGFFDTVELNVTFYRLPKESVFSGWERRTPGNFTFSVKGSRFITHVKRLKDCAEPLKLFFSRVKLLKKKLGPVLWQFPPFFKADPERLAVFLKALKKYSDTRHVFEFRNGTWFSREIFDILKAEGAVLCSADWPAFCNDIRVTADFVYIRRHGRGARLYSSTQAPALAGGLRSLRLRSGQAGFRPPGGKAGAPGLPGGLHSGSYPDSRLRKDAAIIKENLKRKRDVYIYFNNDAGGCAVKNARTLKAMV